MASAPPCGHEPLVTQSKIAARQYGKQIFDSHHQMMRLYRVGEINSKYLIVLQLLGTSDLEIPDLSCFNLYQKSKLSHLDSTH